MFAYTPYDGSATPFSIGLSALDPDEWIEPDDEFALQMAEKERLFRANEAQVYQALEASLVSQAEMLDLLLAYLPHAHPQFYHHDETAREIELRKTGAVYKIDDWGDAPLKLAARLIQDDICLMTNSAEGYRLAAGALCFPSAWSLVEKFGQSMAAIHQDVPGYPGNMAARVDRVFGALQTGRPVWRMNWSLYDAPDLHQPAAKSDKGQISEVGPLKLDQLYIRVERQTLRRLPVSGDLAFTIRIYHDPVACLGTLPHGKALASGLRTQLQNLDKDQLAYKGMTGQKEAIAALLAQIDG